MPEQPTYLWLLKLTISFEDAFKKIKIGLKFSYHKEHNINDCHS